VPGHVNCAVEVSPDGATLYCVDGVFSGGAAPDTADLAIAERRGTGFRRAPGSAATLAWVDTGALEYAAAISAVGRELFFTRAEARISAIDRATRTCALDAFGVPERLDAIDGSVVEAPALAPDERALYYHALDGERFTIRRVTR
jgi:hypothetical protein